MNDCFASLNLNTYLFELEYLITVNYCNLNTRLFRPRNFVCECCCTGEKYPNSQMRSSTDLSELKSVASRWGRDVKVKEREEECVTAARKTTCKCRINDACEICQFSKIITDNDASTNVENASVKPGIQLPKKQLSSISETISEKMSTTDELNTGWNKHARGCPNTLHQNKPCTSLAQSRCSMSTCHSCESIENPVMGLASYLKSYFGFEPINCRHQTRFHNTERSKSVTDISSEGAGSSPFPSAGTYGRSKLKHSCNNQVPVPKPQNISKESNSINLNNSELEPLNLTDCDKETYLKNKLTEFPSRPITAKLVRKGANAVHSLSPEIKSMDQPEKEKNNQSDVQSKIDPNCTELSPKILPSRNQQNDETKTYPSPGVPAPNAPQEYWEQDSDNKSEFSRPELMHKDELEYCEQCGGQVELKQSKDLTYTYRYLIHHNKGKRNSKFSLTYS